MKELLNQIAVLKALLAEKEQQLAESALIEAEKNAEAFKRTHPELECRTGHQTSSTIDNEESYSFIIVEKSCLPINHIAASSSYVWLHMDGEVINDYDDICYGSGQTEHEAWEDAACR